MCQILKIQDVFELSTLSKRKMEGGKRGEGGMEEYELIHEHQVHWHQIWETFFHFFKCEFEINVEPQKKKKKHKS